MTSAVAAVTLADAVAGAAANAAAAQAGTVAGVDVVGQSLRLAGYLVLAAAVAGVGAAVYRWYTGERLPAGLATLFGLAAVALSLQTVGLIGSLTGGAGREVFTLESVALNLLALGAGAVGAPVGRSTGDRLAVEATAVGGAGELGLDGDGDLSRAARALGGVRAVELPADVGAMEGHDPVDPATVERLAGARLVFPARLDDAALRERLVARLRDEFGVGHVDATVADGEVTALAVGSRAAGVGHALAPGTAAVAVRADAPPAAGPGDVVQVWRPTGAGADAAEPPAGPGPGPGPGTGEADDRAENENGDQDAAPAPTAGAGTGGRAGDRRRDHERVVVAELRGVDHRRGTATLVVDEGDVDRLDARTDYRLTALPAAARVDGEFVTVLRNAGETTGVRTVAADDPLVGTPVGEVGALVAAVRPADGPAVAAPAPDRPVAAGDALYLVARPDVLRGLGAGPGSGSDPG